MKPGLREAPPVEATNLGDIISAYVCGWNDYQSCGPWKESELAPTEPDEAKTGAHAEYHAYLRGWNDAYGQHEVLVTRYGLYEFPRIKLKSELNLTVRGELCFMKRTVEVDFT